MSTLSTGAVKDGSMKPPSAKHKGARAVTNIMVNASPSTVWNVLIDFDSYPQIFKRIQSCKVIKRDGDNVVTECFLKPQLFLKQPCQHTFNDLGGKPELLSWHSIDGNFKSLSGCWQLKGSQDNQQTLVTYTLEVDAGPVIPAALVSLLLHAMQKEIVASVKTSAESLQHNAAKSSCASSPTEAYPGTEIATQK